MNKKLLELGIASCVQWLRCECCRWIKLTVIGKLQCFQCSNIGLPYPLTVQTHIPSHKTLFSLFLQPRDCNYFAPNKISSNPSHTDTTSQSQKPEQSNPQWLSLDLPWFYYRHPRYKFGHPHLQPASVPLQTRFHGPANDFHCSILVNGVVLGYKLSMRKGKARGDMIFY